MPKVSAAYSPAILAVACRHKGCRGEKPGEPCFPTQHTLHQVRINDANRIREAYAHNRMVMSVIACFRQLSESIIEADYFDMFSRLQKPKLALLFGVVGAFSFWLPDVIVHFAARRTFDSQHIWLLTFLMPATFLFTYLVARRFAAMHDYKWVGSAMLVGVWLTGGLFMILAATTSGGGFAASEGIRDALWMIALSIIPPVTYMLAGYDGSLFALLAVTIGGLLIWRFQRRWITRPLLRRLR